MTVHDYYMFNKLICAFLLIIAIVGLIDPSFAITVAIGPVIVWGEILKHQVREDIIDENDDDQ